MAEQYLIKIRLVSFDDDHHLLYLPNLKIVFLYLYDMYESSILMLSSLFIFLKLYCKQSCYLYLND